MSANFIKLSEEQIDRLFPFHIVVEVELKICSAGRMIHLLFPDLIGKKLSDCFDLNVDIPELLNVENTECFKCDLRLKGTHENSSNFVLNCDVERVDHGKLLLIGSPIIQEDSKGQFNVSDNSEAAVINSILRNRLIGGNNNIHPKNVPFRYEEPIKGVVVTDEKGGIHWASREFEQSIGYCLTEIRGKRPRSVIYGTASTHIPSNYVDDMVRKKIPFSFDNIGYNKQNNSFWFRTTVYPILDSTGAISGRLYRFSDVTELKERDEALSQNKELWGFALEGAGDGIWFVNIEKKIVDLSQSLKSLVGIAEDSNPSPEELWDMLHPDDRRYLNERVFDSNIEETSNFSVDVRIRVNGNRYKFFHMRGRVLERSNGVGVSFFGTLSDIDTRKKNEAALSTTIAQLSTLVENLNVAVLLENEEGCVAIVNDKFIELFGLDSKQNFFDYPVSDILKMLESSLFDSTTVLRDIYPRMGADSTVSDKLIQTNDGRVLKSDCIEIMAATKQMGRLWKFEDVTKQMTLQKELHTSEVRLTKVIDNFDAAILFEDTKGRILIANKALHRFVDEKFNEILYGRLTSNVLGKIADIFENPQKELERINQLITENVYSKGDLVELTDGRVLSRKFIPIAEEGIEPGYLWIYEDFTEELRSAEKLEEQKRYFHRILDELPADIVIFSPQHKFEFINKCAVKDDEMRKWLIGKDMFDYCNRRNIDTSRAINKDTLFQKTIATMTTQSMVEVFDLKDGSQKHMLRFLYPFADNSGRLDFVVGFGIDISEQVKKEQEVVSQREYYHEILNELPADVVLFDKNHKYRFINKHAVRDDEMRNWLIGKDDYAYCKRKGCDTRLADERRDLFTKVIKSKKPSQTIEENRSADGNISHIQRIMYPVFNKEGELKFAIGYATDITDLVKSKQKAEEHEKQVSILLNFVKDGIFTCDADGHINYYNRSFSQMIGSDSDLSSADISLADMLQESEKTKLEKYYDTLPTGEHNQSIVVDFETSDGTLRHWDFSLIKSTTQNFFGEDLSIGRVSDITEKIERENNLNKLIAKERDLNQTKSQFIRITSHELRTPLAIILANAELLEMINEGYVQESTPQKTGKLIDRIVREVKLMTEMLNELMMISRIEAGKVDIKPVLTDIREFASSILDDLYKPHSDGRVLTLHMSTNASVAFDRSLMRHALVNIINNAFKYSPGKPAPILTVSLENSMLTFEVIDFGIGIPKKDLKRLFSPFYRASNVGNIGGTGLGLMVVDYVVTKHNGSLTFSSRENEGSTFKISIPVIQS